MDTVLLFTTFRSVMYLFAYLTKMIYIYIYIYVCVCVCVCMCVCVSFFCVSMTSLSKAIFFSIFWYNSPIRILAFNTFKAQRLLCVYPGFNKNLRSAHTVYLCVLCGSQYKQLFFPYTVLTEWIYNREVVCLLRGTD